MSFSRVLVSLLTFPQVFTQKGSKYLDIDILKRMLAQLGYNNLSDEDVDVLLETADVDKDGKVSIEDFAAMVSHPYVCFC